MINHYNFPRTIALLYLTLLTSLLVMGQNTPKTISMSGGDNNSTAFSTEGTIATSITTFYTHWDNTYLYIGWSEGQTNYSSDMYYVAIDTDPNTASGTSNAIEGVEFTTGDNLPDYYAVFENNSSFYGIPTSNGNAIELYDGTSGAWNFVSRIDGNDNTESKIDFQDSPNGEVRIRIAWSALGFTPGDHKPIGISYWTNNSNGDFMWSRYPDANPSAGPTSKTLTHQIIFNSTGSGIDPSTSFYENSFSENTKYTSNADGNWNDTNNWLYSGIPIEGGEVTVNNNLILDIDATLDSATVNDGSSVTINSSISLTIADELTLESVSNSYSSLISDGTISGTVLYNRYVNNTTATGGNDLISAPVSGQAFNTFIINNPNIVEEPDPGTRILFGGFDIDTNTYELFDESDTTPFVAGKGYRTGIDAAASTNIVQFEGLVNTTPVGIPISLGVGTAYNLIGNPFPSYLNSQAFLTENLALLDPSATAIYGYNDDTDVLAGGSYTITNYFSTYNLAPGQGFFVASNTLGGNAQFLPSMRSISGSDDFIQGRETNAITNLKLSISTNSQSFLTDFYFSEFSTLGLDPGYDASLFGGSSPAFSLYSHLVEENANAPLGIQALGETDFNDATIVLGVKSNQGEQITFTINSSTIPSTVNVYLDDTVAGTTTLLNTMDYILTPTINLSGTGRFFLRFMDNSLSTQENSLNDLDIYVSKASKELVISGQLLNNTLLKLYDIQGRLVMSTKLDTTQLENRIDISNVNTGIYIAKLHNNTQEFSQKLAIE
ncbi:MAG: T9SS type A sorting domain-containing protein [Psychroserpens sp.]|uniref:T9SS type A sorting domain-containing protein n=1 Tax=Psychroserpens sp. TaxID=2020870 RepID=UPI0030025123